MARNGEADIKGWTASSLSVPEISYTEIFPNLSETTRLRIYEILAHDCFPGILKITNLPPQNIQSERQGLNTLLESVLKRIFGSVFAHPRRGPERTYNISSHHPNDVQKGLLVPNYNTSDLLLPHVDQSFYQNPSRIVALSILEGESDNSFVSGPAVLQTLKEERPELVTPLYEAPMALGRAGKMYTPTIYQGTTTTLITLAQGFSNFIHRFRWHPHYQGNLLCPFDGFTASLTAHRKFGEIVHRPTHQVKLRLKPGDMYLMDNFRVFHGRDRVVLEPRTCVGQSVPEQVVLDGWRDLLISRLIGFMEEKWLIHMPLMQLYEMDKIVNGS
jgi:alpha-ketoglutarate-dependent taurine dioxygenase